MASHSRRHLNIFTPDLIELYQTLNLKVCHPRCVWYNNMKIYSVYVYILRQKHNNINPFRTMRCIVYDMSLEYGHARSIMSS
jgi:hypothetical protein